MPVRRTNPKAKAFCASKRKARAEWVANDKKTKNYGVLVKAACKAVGIEAPMTEVNVLEDVDCTLHPQWLSPKRKLPRQWRHDFFWPRLRLAVEVDGVSGISRHPTRHQTVVGFAADCLKHNAMSILGTRLLRYTPEQLRGGGLLQDLEAMVKLGVLEP